MSWRVALVRQGWRIPAQGVLLSPVFWRQSLPLSNNGENRGQTVMPWAFGGWHQLVAPERVGVACNSSGRRAGVCSKSRHWRRGPKAEGHPELGACLPFNVSVTCVRINTQNACHLCVICGVSVCAPYSHIRVLPRLFNLR